MVFGHIKPLLELQIIFTESIQNEQNISGRKKTASYDIEMVIHEVNGSLTVAKSFRIY